MGGACSTYGESSSVYRVLWGNLGERDNLEDPKSRWEDNIKKNQSGNGIWGHGLDRYDSG